MNLASYLRESAKCRPTLAAIKLDSETAYTFEALYRESQKISHWLLSNGIKAGDRVAVFMPNNTSYLAVLYGILAIGAVAVPINSKLHHKEIAYIFDNSKSLLVFTCAESYRTVLRANGIQTGASKPVIADVILRESFADKMGVPIFDCADGHPAWLFYTSGTTGKPKGATLSHDNLDLMTQSFIKEVLPDMREGDNLIHAAPMSHGSGMYNFAATYLGATQIIPRPKSFDAKYFLNLSCQLGNTISFLAPTMINRLLDADISEKHKSSIKRIVYGGGPMPLATITTSIQKLGQCFAQIYGQGECPMTITRLTREDHVRATEKKDATLTSVGRKFESVEIRIVRAENGSEIGEIEVKSPIVMLGYWDPISESPRPLEDHWLKTGDVGYLDENGYLHLSDRSKDVIVSAGINIYSREIEDVLSMHPMVKEVAIVGRESIQWGEEVVAFIVSQGSPHPAIADLDSFCIQSIARFKRPKKYFFVETLPKNAYGKVEKRTLREWATSNGIVDNT